MPLTLLAGAPSQSLLAVPTAGTQFLTGCGPEPPGCVFAAGEGAISILFTDDVLAFGFEVWGDGGDVTAQFFSRSGAELGSFAVQATDVEFRGFRVSSGDGTAGVSLTNLDGAGVAFDSVTFSTCRSRRLRCCC